ncbi:MAG: DUF547 domain-containing protein [Chlorobi bacterium]|nr:DUF547 domain-containing protein [Chlorobiota bacterium]
MKYLAFFILFFGLNLINYASKPPSHQLWNELLTNNVNDRGQVNYEGIINDKSKLETYLSLLSASEPNDSWGKDNLMAFWINTYNAFTIKLIIDNYPLKSITNLNFNGKSAWDYPFFSINGKQLTLNRIEHEILRKKYADPRIHFAVNCASLSCPKLLNIAFEAETLNETLDKMVREFINDSFYNKISENRIEISQLFDWYREDFTKQGSVIDFLNKYSAIKINKSSPISYIEYNWNLNNQK